MMNDFCRFYRRRIFVLLNDVEHRSLSSLRAQHPRGRALTNIRRIIYNQVILNSDDIEVSRVRFLRVEWTNSYCHCDIGLLFLLLLVTIFLHQIQNIN
jgi:hypothetical protein